MAESPRNADEYLRRFGKNQRVSGYGPERVMVHMPCPFCAAADWAVWRVIETQERMADPDDITCSECGRSGRFLTQRTSNSVGFELVQTGGDDPPDWLTPPIRRI